MFLKESTPLYQMKLLCSLLFCRSACQATLLGGLCASSAQRTPTVLPVPPRKAVHSGACSCMVSCFSLKSLICCSFSLPACALLCQDQTKHGCHFFLLIHFETYWRSNASYPSTSMTNPYYSISLVFAVNRAVAARQPYPARSSQAPSLTAAQAHCKSSPGSVQTHVRARAHALTAWVT